MRTRRLRSAATVSSKLKRLVYQGTVAKIWFRGLRGSELLRSSAWDPYRTTIAAWQAGAALELHSISYAYSGCGHGVRSYLQH